MKININCDQGVSWGIDEPRSKYHLIFCQLGSFCDADYINQHEKY